MSYANEPSSALHSSKPNPLIATKFESHINSGLFFITLNGSLFLIAGALATRYHTTLYIGALAGILSVLLGSTLLLLHKVMDSTVPKSSGNSDGSDTSSIIKGSNLTENGGTGWRDRLRQNLWDGVYPPNQKMGSVLSMVLISILWLISAAISIEYHILIGRGEKPKREIRQGPLSSYGELSFSCLCFALSFVLVITMVIQRRQTSKEMCKALASQVNARPWPPVNNEE